MGPLSAQRAAELCMQALSALAHAHSMGVVHRDLKPANLMVTESGSVKVMDFGIARVSGGEHLTNAGFMMGTPAYMAPEQVRGGDIDARADSTPSASSSIASRPRGCRSRATPRSRWCSRR